MNFFLKCHFPISSIFALMMWGNLLINSLAMFHFILITTPKLYKLRKIYIIPILLYERGVGRQFNILFQLLFKIKFININFSKSSELWNLWESLSCYFISYFKTLTLDLRRKITEIWTFNRKPFWSILFCKKIRKEVVVLFWEKSWSWYEN